MTCTWALCTIGWTSILMGAQYCDFPARLLLHRLCKLCEDVVTHQSSLYTVDCDRALHKSTFLILLLRNPQFVLKPISFLQLVSTPTCYRRYTIILKFFCVPSCCNKKSGALLQVLIQRCTSYYCDYKFFYNTINICTLMQNNFLFILYFYRT